jgi:aspartate kinase
MQQIRNANIPLRLKNVKNPEGNGTIIYPSQTGTNSPKSESEASSVSGSVSDSAIFSFMSANGYYGKSQSRRAPTALTTKDNIVLINIQSNRQKKSHGFLAQVFNKLDEANAVADLITSSEQSVSLAISSLEDDAVKLDRLIASLEKCGKVCLNSPLLLSAFVNHISRLRLRFFKTWQSCQSLVTR